MMIMTKRNDLLQAIIGITAVAIFALFVGIEIGYELGRCKPKRIENTHTIARPQIRTT